jgi:hypothetical protein
VGRVKAPLRKLDSISLLHMIMLVCWEKLSFYLVYDFNNIPPPNCNIDSCSNAPLIELAIALVDNG